jgi:hypothetical protein
MPPRRESNRVEEARTTARKRHASSRINAAQVHLIAAELTARFIAQVRQRIGDRPRRLRP